MAGVTPLHKIKTTLRLLLCLIGLITGASAYAQAPAAPGIAAIGWPSPDGKFAFLKSYREDLHSIDLIDNQSGRKLQQIDEEDSSQADWHVLWAPDSNRFALMTRLGHPTQGVDVYRRTDETFQRIDLPDLPEADIPEKLKHGRNFPHFANLNWQEAKQWNKNGSLVVTIDTMIDGDGRSITATRTVVIGFDQVGKASIVKSTIKYETAKD
ncbi:MAG: hypothetical protein ACTHJS_13525 [Xanthobacteraceae bacterium]